MGDNAEYVNPGPATSIPPVPTEVFPSQLDGPDGQSPEQGGSLSDGGSSAPAPHDPARSGAGAEGMVPGAAEGEGDAGTGDDRYATMTVSELSAEAEERKLTVEGTGANGRVKHDDLAAALRANDAEQAAAE